MKRLPELSINDQENSYKKNKSSTEFTGFTNIPLGTHGRITATVSNEPLSHRLKRSHSLIVQTKITERKIAQFMTTDHAKLPSAEQLRIEIRRAKANQINERIISEYYYLLGKLEDANLQEILISAVISCNKSEYAEAKQQFQRIIDLDPSNHDLIAEKWCATMKLFQLYPELEQKIECLKAFLKLPVAEIGHKYHARKILSALHLELNDIETSIKYYNKIIKMDLVEIIENDLSYLIQSFLQHPSINLSETLEEIETKDDLVQDKIFEILINNPGFFYGQYKLNKDQWDRILDSEVNEDEIFDLFISQYISIDDPGYTSDENSEKRVYLNQELFLENDYTIQQSILRQRGSLITDSILDEGIAKLETIFDNLCKHKWSKDKSNLKNFVDRCLQGRDEEGIEHIKKRIIAAIDLSQDYFLQLDNPTLLLEEKEKVINIIQGAIDIIVDGGKKCGDLAAESLNTLENYLMVFKNEKHKGRIFLNMFKLYCIQDKLIDKKYNENIETQLYYAMQFTSVLGLSLSDPTMLHSEVAKTLPLEEALSILCPAFTAENLMKFTIGHYLFRIIFNPNQDHAFEAKLELLEQEYDDLNDPEEGIMRRTPETILQEIDHVKDSFYANKALEMYLKADFLTERNNIDLI